MKLQATHISARASKALEQSGLFGVKAVFERVINLQGEKGEYVALQKGGTAFTPLSVVVAQPDFQRLQSLRAGGRVELEVAYDHLIDCLLPASEQAPSQGWRDSFRRLSFALAKADSLAPVAHPRLWGALEHPNQVQCKARELLERATEEMNRGGSGAAAAILSGLSGLGPGLTPAGDDFLLGVLAVCRRWPRHTPKGFAAALANALAAGAGQRTWLSGALLDCALCGEYSLDIQNIVTARENEALAKAVAAGVACGHTSGSDTLGGILWMTEHLTRQA